MEDAHPKGLTLVLGPANSGKMGQVLDWWLERSSLLPVVAAPTGPDARGLTWEMARRLGGFVGQSPALTFDGLVDLLLGTAPRYATDLEQTLIISSLLRVTLLDALAPAVDLPGLSTALLGLFRQLGESGKSPEEVDRVLARWAAEPGGASLAGDVRRLVAGYRRELVCRRLSDRPSAVSAALNAVAGWSRPVAFYGFTSFTLGQRGLVQGLCGEVEVLVTLAHDPSRAVDLTTAEEMRWWKGLASRVVEVSPRDLAYDSPAVAYLEKHLMSDAERPAPPQAYSDPGTAASGEAWPQGRSTEHVRPEGVRFLLGSGRRAEAELAAQEVAGLLRAGFLPGEIAVVVRRVGEWRRVLRHVFDSCGVPYQIDERCPLADTGLGHAFLRATEGAALDDVEGVLAYARSPYSGAAPEEVSDLELRYRRGTSTGTRALRALATSMNLQSLDRVWTLIEPRGGISNISASRFDTQAAATLAADMLAAGLRGTIVGSREADDDARAYRALRAALETLVCMATAGEEGIDPRTVLGVLRSVEVAGRRSDGGDAVQILSVQRARARRFKAVLVLGLVEGEFPGRPDRVSLLDSAQRARLDALGGGMFSPEPDEEAALFVSAVSRGSRIVLLSARDAEDDGGDAAPSYFWLSAKHLLGVGEQDHSARTLADQVFSPEIAPSERHYLRACAAGGSRPAEIGWDRPPTRLVAREVLAELGSLQCFSPSVLESYAGCPFRWFVERVIGVEEIDFELDGRMVGQLLHEALRATYSRLASDGLLPLRAAGLPSAERIAGALIDGLVASDGCPGTPAGRRIAGQRLKRMAHNLFEMEVSAGGALVPAQTEMSVGGDTGVDIGGLNIRGRVDRMDVDPVTGGSFVVDYKTGGTPAVSALGTGEGLQLPLYLLAIQAEQPERIVTGGAYLGLTARERAGVVVSGYEQMLGEGTKGVRVLDAGGRENLFRTTRETALGAAEGIRTGVIAPLPDRRCPAWCRLGPACRSRRGGYRP